jgi:hypothetical protein
VVHQNLITAASKFFASAFEAGFAETVSKEIQLPETNSKLFEAFVCRLYNSTYTASDCLKEHKANDDTTLLDLYRMADALMIPGLQLYVVREIRFMYNHFSPLVPSQNFITSVFDNFTLNLTFFQDYIVKHVSFWVGKTTDKATWIQLFDAERAFAVAMATELARGTQSTGAKNAQRGHPSTWTYGEFFHGLDIKTLTAQARAGDIKRCKDLKPAVPRKSL